MTQEALHHEAADPIGFRDLILKAVKGTEEDWAFIEEHFKATPPTKENLEWALDMGLSSDDQNIRDFAVTLFNMSDMPLGDGDTEKLSTALQDPYHIVRIRAAMALRKRGSKDAIVEHILRKASDENDPDLGEQAEQCLKETSTQN